MIRNGSKEQFEYFIQEINSWHSTTKFDYEIHYKEVTFLDVMLFIDSDGKLKTKLYRKKHIASITFTPNLKKVSPIVKYCA